jgi:hypothetical protein
MFTVDVNNKTFMHKEILRCQPVDLSVFSAILYISFFDIRYFDYIDVYVICIEADKYVHCHNYSVLENHYFGSYIFEFFT